MECDSERNKDKQHAEWIRESVLGQCGKFEFYALLSGSQWRYLRMSIFCCEYASTAKRTCVILVLTALILLPREPPVHGQCFV